MIPFEKSHSHDDTKIGSDRAFGLVFASISAIVALWPIRYGQPPYWIFVAVSATFLVAALTFPRFLAAPNRAWLRFGLLLHRIVTPLILGVIFVAVFVPMGILLRLLGKDLLRLKRSRGTKTYWIARDNGEPGCNSMSRQF